MVLPIEICGFGSKLDPKWRLRYLVIWGCCCKYLILLVGPAGLEPATR